MSERFTGEQPFEELKPLKTFLYLTFSYKKLILTGWTRSISLCFQPTCI